MLPFGNLAIWSPKLGRLRSVGRHVNRSRFHWKTQHTPAMVLTCCLGPPTTLLELAWRVAHGTTFQNASFRKCRYLEPETGPAEIGRTPRQPFALPLEDPNCTGDGSNVLLRSPDDSPGVSIPCSARHNVPECFLSEISLFGARNWPAEIGGTLRQSLPPPLEDPNCTGDGSNVLLRYPDNSPGGGVPCGARHNVPDRFISEISLFGARKWPG